MIIAVCTDDPTITRMAIRSSEEDPNVFGAWYEIYDYEIPKPARDENLFLIAHGAYDGDEGRPVIGDSRNAFYLHGEDVLVNLERILPRNYMGNIYVDACESADHKETVSFIEVLKASIMDKLPQTRVFGRAGESRGKITLPGDRSWVEAGGRVANDTRAASPRSNLGGAAALNGVRGADVHPLVSSTAANTLANAHGALASILEDSSQDAFSDSDGLISFVNLSSSFVQNNPEFKTGQNVTDQVANFMSSIRQNTFGALTSGRIQPLPGDKVPTSQWDLPVTNVIMAMLRAAKGFSNFSVTEETFSNTQVLAEFSTDFIKLLFDAAVVPEAVIADVTKFIQGVGGSLRTSWDDRQRSFEVAILASCHEAVPMASGDKDFRYFPKVKYYHLTVDSSQQEFTSPCVSVQKITFNFKYQCYVTALAFDVLDTTSQVYKDFTGFLNKAQNVNYKQANNTLDSILNTTSGSVTDNVVANTGTNLFAVRLSEYPKVNVKSNNRPRIEEVLNQMVV